MQPLTQEFVFTQLRIAFIAIIAYAGGAGYFSPAGVTLATALVASILPIAVPWGMSLYANWRTTRVPVDLEITPADVRKVTGADSMYSAAPVAAVVEAAKKAAPLILIVFLILPLSACATAPAGSAGGVVTVSDVQARIKRLCSFAATAETILDILKVDTGSAGQIASGVCAALQTIPQFAIASLYQPQYKGVTIRGKFL